MPPIINSHSTGKITEKTKDVFIECSGFDLDALKILLNIIVTALADMGGEIYSMELFYDKKKEITPDLSPKKMKLDTNYVNKILGLSLNDTEIKKLLERMGFSYNNKQVLIPSYRADILHPIDIVEDIAIAHGYENFTPEIPKIATIAKEDPLEIFKVWEGGLASHGGYLGVLIAVPAAAAIAVLIQEWPEIKKLRAQSNE